MAIDFMIMPLSRYLAGDFVTPVMRLMWEQGTPYMIIGPDGTRQLPPNTPFGGVDATAQRRRFVPMVLDDLQSAPFESWDEASDVEPRFHRVDPRSFGALLEHAERGLGTDKAVAAAKPSWLGKLLRRGSRTHESVDVAHLLGTVFAPCDLAAPVEIESPLQALVTSVPRALRALEAAIPPEAESARDTLLDALRDARELGLPMIVDS